MTLAIAAAAGVLVGLSLGALGGGGSILAVPILVYGLGQSPAQATTGSQAKVSALNAKVLPPWETRTATVGTRCSALKNSTRKPAISSATSGRISCLVMSG